MSTTHDIQTGAHGVSYRLFDNGSSGDLTLAVSVADKLEINTGDTIRIHRPNRAVLEMTVFSVTRSFSEGVQSYVRYELADAITCARLTGSAL